MSVPANRRKGEVEPGEWDRRELCPDGACVGVIGPTGTCKVCGRVAPHWGEERKRGLRPTDPPPDEQEDEDEQAEPRARGAAADGGEWRKRKLCEDGACVGVIGADGACKVCGKRAGVRAEPEEDDDEDDELARDDDERSEGEDEDDDDDGDEDEDGEEEDDDEDEDEDDDERSEGDDEYEDDEDEEEDDDEEDEDDDEDEDEDDSDDEQADEADDDLAARRLCPDGACIGVIGDDDRCKVCRKAAA